MRTRREIFEDADRSITPNGLTIEQYILEVLLDIREMLIPMFEPPLILKPLETGDDSTSSKE